MLRRRHLPFKIGDTARDQWMHCMRKALGDSTRDPDLHNGTDFTTAGTPRRQASLGARTPSEEGAPVGIHSLVGKQRIRRHLDGPASAMIDAAVDAAGGILAHTGTVGSPVHDDRGRGSSFHQERSVGAFQCRCCRLQIDDFHIVEKGYPALKVQRVERTTPSIDQAPFLELRRAKS